MFDIVLSLSRDSYDMLIGLPWMDVLDGDELRARVAMTLARTFGGDPLEARAARAATPNGQSWSRAHATGDSRRWWPHLAESVPTRARGRTEEHGGRRQAASLGQARWTAARVRPSLYDQFSEDDFWGPLCHASHAQSGCRRTRRQLRASCAARSS